MKYRAILDLDILRPSLAMIHFRSTRVFCFWLNCASVKFLVTKKCQVTQRTKTDKHIEAIKREQQIKVVKNKQRPLTNCP